MVRLISNIKRYILRYRFMSNGCSEITGEFGEYHTRYGSNTVLFIPEKDRDELPSSRRFKRKFATAVAEAIDEMESRYE